MSAQRICVCVQGQEHRILRFISLGRSDIELAYGGTVLPVMLIWKNGMLVNIERDCVPENDTLVVTFKIIIVNC